MVAEGGRPGGRRRGGGVERWVQVGALSLGGSLGADARFWPGLAINRWAGPQFPWATLAINVSGSFLIGALTAALARWLPHPGASLLVVTRFLGGYTTFSTFAFESLTLWERGERAHSVGYVAGSMAGGLVAAALGVGLVRGLADAPEGRAASGIDAPSARRAGGRAGLALPSYSPGFSPIEEMFSKFKNFLRRVGAQAKGHLYDAIGAGLREVSDHEMLGCFCHAGLCATRT